MGAEVSVVTKKVVEGCRRILFKGGVDWFSKKRRRG